MKLETSFLLASLAASAAAAPALNPNAAKRWANSPDGQELHADVVAALRRLARNPSLREGAQAAPGEKRDAQGFEVVTAFPRATQPANTVLARQENRGGSLRGEIAARQTDVVQIVTARQAPVTQINQGDQNPAPVTQVGGGGNDQNPAPVTQVGGGGNGGNPAPVTQLGGNSGPSQAGQGENGQNAQPTQVLQARQRGRGGRGGRNGAATQAGQAGTAQNSQPTQNPAPAAPVAGQNPVPTQAVQNPAPVAPVPQPTQVAQGGNVQNPAAGTQAGQTGIGQAPAAGTQAGQTGGAQAPAPVTQVGQTGNGQIAQPTQIVKARQVPGDSIGFDLHGRQTQPTQAAYLPGDSIVVRQNAPIIEIDQGEVKANSQPLQIAARQNSGGTIIEFITERQNAPQTEIVQGIPQPTQIVQARQNEDGQSRGENRQAEEVGQNDQNRQADNRIIQQGRRYAAPQASEVIDFRPQATQVVQARQNEDFAGAPEDNSPSNPQGPSLPPTDQGNRNEGGGDFAGQKKRYAAPQASEVFDFRPQSTQVVQARQNGQNQNNEDFAGAPEDNSPSNPQGPAIPDLPPTGQGNRNSQGGNFAGQRKRYAAPQSAGFDLPPQATQVVQARQNSQSQGNGDFAGAPEDNTPNDPLPELPPNEEGNRNSQGGDFASPGKRYASPQDLPPLSSFGDDRLVTRQQGQAGQDAGPSDGGLQPPALPPIPTGPLPPIDENSAGVVVISARQQGRAGEEQNSNDGPSLPPARNPISTGPDAPVDNDSNGQGVVITARQQGGAGEGDSNSAPLLPPARNPISTGPGAPIDNDSNGQGVVISARQDEPAAAPDAPPPPTRPLNSRQSGLVEPDTDADAQNPNPRVPSEPIARDNGGGAVIDARQTEFVEPDLGPTTPGGPSGPNGDGAVIVVARQIVALPDDPNAPEDPIPVDNLDA
ncbi:hypothetical protein FB567DRAFT_585602 [Paraphoma chrysanthemicola]|uniref:Uncharacterized protein n=1 Tax=Paraphoma chrysanthemicola TaxID=798071 RepID=A0A8K0QRU0_9PLEO|nr:hypothetical protein FB567DRAFT_585602 [Paraphoma chrysanthemicola]